METFNLIVTIVTGTAAVLAAIKGFGIWVLKPIKDIKDEMKEIKKEVCELKKSDLLQGKLIKQSLDDRYMSMRAQYVTMEAFIELGANGPVKSMKKEIEEYLIDKRFEDDEALKALF